MDLKKYIRNIPNFPKEGILFRDITPLLAEVSAYQEALNKMAEFVSYSGAEAIVAIESRGFMFACPVAEKLKLPFVPVRKPGKLPHKTKSVEYELEYGKGTLQIHDDVIKEGMKAAVIDDLLATGGTASAAARLIEACGGVVCSYSFLIELRALGGRKLLNNADIQALIAY